MQEPQNRRTTFLVTGAAGFIGSHLCEALVRMGHPVQGIDDLSTGSLENLSGLIGNPAFAFARADIADEVVMDRLTSQADVVIHLAAAVGVKLIVERPVHTIQTNIMGTEAVLRTALRYGCRVLIASTSEVYGKGYKIPFNEDDDVLLGATQKNRWAYAASKMVDEFLGLAYHREYGLDVVPFRLFNTVGPRQTGQYGMVIPRFVQQALKGEPLTVYGDGTQCRCFCDIRDVIAALTGLAFHVQATGRVFNIGSGEEISMLDLARKVKKMTRSRSEIVLVPYDQAYAPGFEDMQRRVPDVTRIHGLLGWKSRHSLSDTLASVIEWERRRRRATRR